VYCAATGRAQTQTIVAANQEIRRKVIGMDVSIKKGDGRCCLIKGRISAAKSALRYLAELIGG
jgi:hypothetical protein